MKVWVKYVVASLLEKMDYYTYEDIKKQYITFCFANEKNVRIIRVSIHCSNSSICLANFAKFTGNFSIFETINENFSMPTIVVFILDVLLESCSKVRIGTIPTNVRACVIRFSFSAFIAFVVQSQNSYHLRLIIFELPQATTTIFSSSCPHIIVITPLYLNDLFSVGLCIYNTRQS